MRRAVPEEDRFAAVDLDDLDVVDARGVREQRRRAPAAGDDQPVGVLRPQRMLPPLEWPGCLAVFGAGEPSRSAARKRAAAASARSPWKTRPRASTAGTSRTPAARASAVARASCSAVERSAAPAQHRGGMHLAGRRRDHDGVLVVESAPAGEGLAEGGLGERHGAADRAARRWRHASPGGCRTGTARASAAAAGRAPRRVARRARSSASRSASQRNASKVSAPGSSAASTGTQTTGSPAPSECLQRLLGGEVRERAREIEVEGGASRRAHRARPPQPWISQPSAARPASITASESVGWPWMIRPTSGKPPSSARMLTSSWISSVAREPTMCPPSSSP